MFAVVSFRSVQSRVHAPTLLQLSHTPGLLLLVTLQTHPGRSPAATSHIDTHVQTKPKEKLCDKKQQFLDT
jgi:hypothetical protein